MSQINDTENMLKFLPPKVSQLHSDSITIIQPVVNFKIPKKSDNQLPTGKQPSRVSFAE